MNKSNGYLKIYLVFSAILFSFLTVKAQTPEIKQMLENAYTKGEFSGVMAVSKSDRLLAINSIGEANRDWKISNSVATKFRICSVTKQFTAMLVMQLAEQEKINLDAPISEYLPEFRKETANKVSVRNLLLSASGLPVLPDEFYVNEDSKMTDANFVIGKYLQGDLLFNSG
nr:serine hydrolase domain-containing protein [Pyrinomonadaceae bacterium]